MSSTEAPASSDAKPSKTYDASCHCGAIKYSVVMSPPLDQAEVTNCNCSICSANGYLLVPAPNSTITFKSGEDVAKGYKFGKARVRHSFCPSCGTSMYAESDDPDFFPGIKMVNIRTFAGVDPTTLKLKPFDGKSL